MNPVIIGIGLLFFLIGITIGLIGKRLIKSIKDGKFIVFSRRIGEDSLVIMSKIDIEE